MTASSLVFDQEGYLKTKTVTLVLQNILTNTIEGQNYYDSVRKLVFNLEW